MSSIQSEKITNKMDTNNLILEFNKGTLPKSKWNHEAHLVVSLWYCIEYDSEKALNKLREKIRYYNEAVGTPNTTGIQIKLEFEESGILTYTSSQMVNYEEQFQKSKSNWSFVTRRNIIETEEALKFNTTKLKLLKVMPSDMILLKR